MPRTRSHRTKLAPRVTAKDVTATTKVDPKLAAAWEKLFARISAAESRGAEAFDELWEAAGEAVHHDPPLYVFGGYKSASDFFSRALHADLRSATRNMSVAAHATPREEEQYGVSNIAAALEAEKQRRWLRTGGGAGVRAWIRGHRERHAAAELGRRGREADAT